MVINLTEKVAIVTGGTRGIGREIALTLGREGVKTVVLGVQRRNLDALADEFCAQHYEGQFHVCDVRNSQTVERVVDDTVKKYGAIDILVNNAGVSHSGSVDVLDEETWDLTQAINLKGTFLMSKAVAPVMKQQRHGRIINAASFAAIVPSLGTAAYAASKAGVVQFTRVLAGELGPWNITVNCYVPGMVPTDMNHLEDQPQQDQERLLDLLTLRRWGQAREVAQVVCFLASDLASYITGTCIDVSGGKLATQMPQRAYEEEASGRLSPERP